MQRPQCERFASPQPQWLRVLAMLCVMLVTGASTAQAAHKHGDWLPQGGKHLSIPAAMQGQSEEHCSLCVAMHSAMPAIPQIAVAPVCDVVGVATTFVASARAQVWSFAMFSRPPPAAAVTRAAGAAPNDAPPAATTAG